MQQRHNTEITNMKTSACPSFSLFLSFRSEHDILKSNQPGGPVIGTVPVECILFISIHLNPR